MAISDKKPEVLSSVMEELSKDDKRFEELETYPIEEPYAYVRILFDKENFSRIYEVIEPPLTPEENEVLERILDIMKRAFSVRIEDIEGEPQEFLINAVKKILKDYKIRIGKKKPSEEQIEHLIYYVRRNQLGYGRIDVLMHDPNIEDVSCDAPGVHVYIYHRKYENMETTIMWEDEVELESYIIRLAQRCGKHISVAEPLLDATLMDGSRVVMKLGKEVSTKGSTFTIRKFREDPFTPTDLVEFGTVDSRVMAYLWLAVQNGMSMMFVGGTASGKTTTLNALSLFIGWHVKIVSIEETRELNLPHPNWIPGCTREGFGGEGAAGGKAMGVVDMYDLLKAALRERPEYILVGEIRGAEAYVVFQAMSTGHTCYTTIHAESVPQLIHRLENKPINIPRVMMPVLDGAVIQIQTRIGGRRVRRVKEVVEIIGLDPHSNELLSNQAFYWDARTDTYNFSAKSYILDKLMVKLGKTREEMQAEMAQRRAIIEWWVKRSIRSYKEVSRIISEYYINPDDVVREMENDLAGRGSGRFTGGLESKELKTKKEDGGYDLLTKKEKNMLKVKRERLEVELKKVSQRLKKMSGKVREKNEKAFKKKFEAKLNRLEQEEKRMIDKATKRHHREKKIEDRKKGKGGDKKGKDKKGSSGKDKGDAAGKKGKKGKKKGDDRKKGTDGKKGSKGSGKNKSGKKGKKKSGK